MRSIVDLLDEPSGAEKDFAERLAHRRDLAPVWKTLGARPQAGVPGGWGDLVRWLSALAHEGASDAAAGGRVLGQIYQTFDPLLVSALDREALFSGAAPIYAEWVVQCEPEAAPTLVRALQALGFKISWKSKLGLVGVWAPFAFRFHFLKALGGIPAELLTRVAYGSTVLEAPRPELATEEPGEVYRRSRLIVWPAARKEVGLPLNDLKRALRDVVFAIVDSGVDREHPDLKSKKIEAIDLTFDRDDLDHNGHGSHCLTNAVGDGSASGPIAHPFYSREFEGAAPYVERVLSIKLFDRTGRATNADFLRAIAIVAGRPEVDVLSLSLGGSDPSGGNSIEEIALRRCQEKNGLSIAAAVGNSGRTSSIVSPAGGLPDAEAVAALDPATMRIAAFSSRGPGPDPNVLRPSCCAPGVKVVAGRSSNCDWPSIPGNSHYACASGTSMATPIVAGVLAILRAAVKARM